MRDISISGGTFKETQFGDNNKMVIVQNSGNDMVNWDELEKLLLNIEDGGKLNEQDLYIAQTALEYTKKRDKKGLKGFILENKDIFINNVLSNVVSAGIISFINLLLH